MPISIVVPQLGESVAEGTVSRWLKRVGEKVRREEPLVEIQTDKINVEIPSPAEGVLQAITVPEGTTVLVGTEIGVLAGADEAVAVAASAAASAAAPPAPARAALPASAAAPAPAGAFTVAAQVTAPAPATAGADHGNGGGEPGGPRRLSPAVRKIMREQEVSPREVDAIRGSGIAGRVTRDDLLEYLATRGAQPVP
ncbi:MAG: E3 binding domain-containing protein, partial [Candidatus Eisenbacteria bacterium]|nr:E3 binding domain-containing protein [Candidatus Eisenbacteria bacterium]